jgi:hypothetical protein
MSSANGLWTIHYLNADWRSCPDIEEVGCGGQTGRWNRVPEPATLALFGVGLLGFAVSRRKRVGGTSA